MAATNLATVLLTESARPEVAAELDTVVSEQVKATKGFTGAAVKTGHGLAQKVRPGFIRGAINQLLPEFLAELQPWWDSYPAPGSGAFGDHLAQDGDAVAEALLSITDRKAEASQRASLKKTYQGLRGKGVSHVRDALPAVGRAIEKHAA